MTPLADTGPGPAGKAGLAERYKAFRDAYLLKPLLVAILYLIIPLATFQLIMLQYPGLDASRFRNATLYIVPAAFLLVAVAFAQASRPKGRPARLALDACYVVLSLVWMIAIVGGNTVIRSEYESHPFSIDVTPLIAIGFLTAGLNFAHDVWEYLHYRPTGTRAPADAPAVPVAGLSGDDLPPAKVPASTIFRSLPLAVYAGSYTLDVPDCTQEPLRCQPWAPAPGEAPGNPVSLVVEDTPVAVPGPPMMSARAGNTAITLDLEKMPDSAGGLPPAGDGGL